MAPPFEQRSLDWDVIMLPVPADLLVYTLDEWQHLPQEGRFYRAAMEEAVWIFDREKGETQSHNLSGG